MGYLARRDQAAGRPRSTPPSRQRQRTRFTELDVVLASVTFATLWLFPWFAMAACRGAIEGLIRGLFVAMAGLALHVITGFYVVIAQDPSRAWYLMIGALAASAAVPLVVAMALVIHARLR